MELERMVVAHMEEGALVLVRMEALMVIMAVATAVDTVVHMAVVMVEAMGVMVVATAVPLAHGLVEE